VILVGLTGKAGCGKDTVGKHMADAYGFSTYSFATPMRNMIMAGFGLTMEQLLDRKLKEQVIDWIGRSPRYLMQRIGTEWGRNLVADDIWLRCASQAFGVAENEGYPGVAITDVRFDNEADFIRDLGGFVVHVHRPGLQAVAESGHISEAGVKFKDGDQRIINDSTIGELYEGIDAIMSMFGIEVRA
jgi:hypothetical protein